MRYYSVILSPQHWCPDLEKQKMDVLSPLVSSKMLIEDTDIMFGTAGTRKWYSIVLVSVPLHRMFCTHGQDSPLPG
jgi:hypothetical protein